MMKIPQERIRLQEINKLFIQTFLTICLGTMTLIYKKEIIITTLEENEEIKLKIIFQFKVSIQRFYLQDNKFEKGLKVLLIEN